MPEEIRALILTYLAAAYEHNAQAEVSGIELQHELGLNPYTLETSVRTLLEQGMVDWDPLVSNIWLRITDKGLATAARAGRPEDVGNPDSGYPT